MPCKPWFILAILMISISKAYDLFTQYDEWNVSTSQLPRADAGMAVFQDADAMYMIGGIRNPLQIIKYNISTQIFTDYGIAASSNYVIGYGQFFTQNKNMLYMVRDTYLHMLDLKTSNISSNDWINTSFGYNVATMGCVSANDKYVYVIAGGSIARELDKLQVYSIDTDDWVYGKPMQIRKRALSCAYHPKTHELYAIGGIDYYAQYLNTVEILLTNTDGYPVFNKNIWNFGTNLSFAVAESRAIINEDVILVIGGTNNVFNSTLNVIQIIDTVSGATTYQETMITGVMSAATIKFNQVAYIFGGVKIRTQPYDSLYCTVSTSVQYKYLKYGPNSQIWLTQLDRIYGVENCSSICSMYTWFSLLPTRECFCGNDWWPEYFPPQNEHYGCDEYGGGWSTQHHYFHNDTVYDRQVQHFLLPTKNPTVQPTVEPTTTEPTRYPTEKNQICMPRYIGYLDSKYAIAFSPEFCENVRIQWNQFTKVFINILDEIYLSNNFWVFSYEVDNDDITEMCGFVSFKVITCFDNETDSNNLAIYTESNEFEAAINKRLNEGDYFPGPLVVYVESTTVKTIFGADNDTIVALGTMEIIIIVIVMVIICVFCVVLMCYIRRQYKLKPVFIKNPMVLLFAIGEYDKDIPDDVDFVVNDLNVDIDVKNMSLLFNDKLNYETYPTYKQYPKLHWTKNELIDYLKKFANIFAKNVISISNDNASNNNNGYDSLILVVSGHGIDNHIITSDYQLIHQDVFHRMFSSYYPCSREVPRIAIFDSCQGDETAKSAKTKKSSNITEEKEGGDDVSKNVQYEGFNTTDITPPLNRVTSEVPSLWDRNTKNPDENLVKINASNAGFQSKMNDEVGSYLISKFVDKTLNGIEDNEQKFLCETMDEIQKELADMRKQLPTALYNNNTRNILFMMNDNEDKIYEEKIELVEVMNKSQQAKELLIEFEIPEKYINKIIANMVEEKCVDPTYWIDIYDDDKAMKQLGMPKIQIKKFKRKYVEWLKKNNSSTVKT
eukprot:118988_1